MGRGRYKLISKVRQEEADIQKKAKKRGLWASLGSALLGGLAMIVTGGAAAPWAASLIAGASSWLGGKAGDYLAKMDDAKIKGEGEFLSGQREGVVSTLQETIDARALKTGLTAGLTKMGGKLSFGKGGMSVTAGGGKEGFSLKKLFARGAETPGAYGEGWELGKAIDFKGSWLGKKVGAATGAYNPDVGWVTGADIGADLKTVLPTELQTATGVTGLDRVDPAYKNYQFGETGVPGQKALTQLKEGGPFVPEETLWSRAETSGVHDYTKPAPGPRVSSYGSTIGTTDYMSDISKIDVPEMNFWKRRNQDRLTSRELLQKQKTEKLWDWEKSPEGPDFIGPQEIIDPIDSGSIRGQSQWDTFKSSESILDPSMADVSPQIPEVAGGPAKLTTGQRVAYDKINKMSDAGYDVSAGGGLPEEYGKGYIDLDTGETRRPPTRPNVPVASEDEFFDKDIIVEDTDFDDFDEASWEAGRKRLQQVDADLARQQYWGSKTPAVEALSQSETGTGLKYHQYQPQADTNFGLQSSDYDLLAPSRKRAADLQRSVSWQNRLFGNRSKYGI